MPTRRDFRTVERQDASDRNDSNHRRTATGLVPTRTEVDGDYLVGRGERLETYGDNHTRTD